MKAVRTNTIRATADEDLTKLALRKALSCIFYEPATSATRSIISIAILHEDGNDEGMVLAAVTLSGYNLNLTQAVRAYQDLANGIPGLTTKISAGTFLIHVSVESAESIPRAEDSE